MTATLHVTIDAQRVRPSHAVKMAARSAPLLILSTRTLDALSDELGGMEAAGYFLIGLATTIKKPIGVHVEHDDGTSRTAFVAPRGWSQERLAGWVAGRHEDLAAAFGACVPAEEVDP